jgi:hypothetical protein
MWHARSSTPQPPSTGAAKGRYATQVTLALPLPAEFVAVTMNV